MLHIRCAAPATACSRRADEVQGRVVVVDKVDPAQERQRQSVVARTGGDIGKHSMQRLPARRGVLQRHLRASTSRPCRAACRAKTNCTSRPCRAVCQAQRKRASRPCRSVLQAPRKCTSSPRTFLEVTYVCPRQAVRQAPRQASRTRHPKTLRVANIVTKWRSCFRRIRHNRALSRALPPWTGACEWRVVQISSEYGQVTGRHATRRE